MQIEIDKIDRQLIGALQDNARLTSGEIAQRVNLSQSPSWRRIKRLEDAGVITGYSATLDRRALGYGALAFVMVTIDHQNEESKKAFQAAVCAMPEVVMFHAISGIADYLLVVLARDLDSYSDMLVNKLHNLPSVQQLHTHFSLKEYKGQICGLPVSGDEAQTP